MSNIKLSPDETASAALAVYDVKKSRNINDIFKVSKIYDHFQFDSKISNKSGSAITFVKAKSGAFEFKSNTGFGVIAKGKGKFEGDAIIVCRGTASIYDGLTDLNAGVQSSRTGNAVHAGFNRTFNQFRPRISEFLSAHRPRRVHCVGHSLGGALATLAADFVAVKGSKASLYTFGSPRVGMNDFATRLSLHEKVGIDHIHRVYHGGDPVSMVPLWPFVHVPQPGGECYIGKHLSFNPVQHLMEKYIDSVHDKTWDELRNPHPNWDDHAIEWVTSGKAGALLGLNFYNLAMAGGAIRLAVKKVLTTGITGAGFSVIAGASVLDQLSMLLDRAASLSAEDENFVMGLMKRLLAMAGISIKKTQSLTHAFIRWVLNTLSMAINRLVGISMQMVHMGI